MKEKNTCNTVKNYMVGLTFFMLSNVLIWGLMQAYVKTYNTINESHIVMVDIVNISNNTAKIDVLDKSISVDYSLINSEEFGKYSYALLPTSVKLAIDCIDIIENYS